MYAAVSTVDGSLPEDTPAKNTLQRPGLASRHTDSLDQSPDAHRSDDTFTGPAAPPARTAATASGPYNPAKLVQWGINWLSVVQMLSLFAAGVFYALVHHFYYHSLHGTEVTQITDTATARWNLQRQEWKIRIGTGLAFIAKTCLASAICIAYKQRIWASCRQRAYSISGLDALFSATTNLLAFANLELLTKTKTATVLAACVWLLPLSALITPATLTIIPVTQHNTRSGRVPQVDFHPRNIGSLPFDGFPNATIMRDDVYLWNSEPSPLLTRISMAAASSMSILPMPPQAPNSSWTVDFSGPSFQCEESEARLQNVSAQVGGAVKREASGRRGATTLIYMAFTLNKDMLNGKTVDDLQYFASRCVLGGASCSRSPYPRDQSLILSLAKPYTCVLKNTSFSAAFRSSADRTTVELIKYKRQDMDPSDNPTYGAVGMAIGKILTGTYYLTYNYPNKDNRFDVTMSAVRTSIGSTALMALVNQQRALDDGRYIPNYVDLPAEDFALAKNQSLVELVEELSRNITLSLFSSPRLWTNKSGYSDTVINFDRPVNVYKYNARNLWIAYGVAIVVTLGSIGVGLLALFSNGVSHGINFSNILATTRNSSLDALVVGSSLGAVPMSKDILNAEIMFGVFKEDDHHGDGVRQGAGRVGFGFKSQVKSIERGAECY